MKKDSEKTKLAIRQAFLKLYEKERIEKISIGEIAKGANIYRGTFYYYYQDIYDLLGKIEEEFYEEVIKTVHKVISGIFNGDIKEKVEDIYNGFKPYKSIFILFFIKKPNGLLINKIKNGAKEIAINKLGFNKEELNDEVKYAMEYIASAQMGLITSWIGNGEDISILKLAEIIEMANLRGPMSILINYSNKNKI